MKIVVQGSDGDAWWAIVNDKGKHVAQSHNTFFRRSDAKRSAARFIKDLGDSYYYEPFNGIELVMEDPR